MKFSILAWLADSRKQRSRKRPIRPVRPALTLEYLEDRLVPAVIAVNTTDDFDKRDANLSLREAIELANGTLKVGALTAMEKPQVTLGDPSQSASNTIIFKIANAPQSISIVNSPLPDLIRPAIINGADPGGLPNQTITLDGQKLNAINLGKKFDPANTTGIVLSYEVDDKGAVTSTSSNSTIMGLTVQNFYTDGIRVKSNDNHIGGSGTGEQNTIQKNGNGVHIIGSVQGGDRNTLVGNSILDSVSSANQTGVGVYLEGNASANVIGKEAPSAKGIITTPANVISGNQNAGISITKGISNIIIGNFIGLNNKGDTAQANGTGIKIEGASSDNRIGGTLAGERNIISASNNQKDGEGILVDGAGATANKIEGNNIGTKIDGTGAVGNRIGIAFTNGAKANTVKYNRIKFNANAGILKEGSDKQNYAYDPNSIDSNGSGIDDGTPDGPVLTSATVSGNAITIQGTLTSTPNTSFILEFFGNTALDGSGNAEGEFYLGTATVITDANGNSSFQATFNAVYGTYITATATNPAEGGFTSQFSNAVTATGESSNAAIGGKVWDDADADGLPDNGEAGQANVNVQLFTALGSLVASATSDAIGNYLFSNVTPGDYYLQFASPSGFFFTTPYQGDDTIASHADPVTGDTEQFSLIAGEVDPYINAGVIPTSLHPATTTTLTSTGDPSNYGSQVTFIATVTQTDVVPLGGTVTFKDGATVLGTVDLSSDSGDYQAAFTTSALSVGDHNITATYNGDSFHAGSSASLTQTVQQALSFTSVTSSATPALAGQPVTFTATVDTFSSVPTGTVTFQDGTTTLGTGTLDANGNATFTTSTLPLGSHDITANYDGDSNFTASSGTLTQVVSQEISSSVSLSSSVYAAQPGQDIIFTATVSGNSGTPTGNVLFMEGNNVLGTASLDSNGHATFTTALASPGNHTIIAIYGGDATYGSNDASLTQMVNLVYTNTGLLSSAPSSYPGQAISLTASVGSGGHGIPTGAVSLYDGTSLLATLPLDANGQATLTLSTLALGSHTLTAVYQSDGVFGGSSGSTTQNVNLINTSVFLNSDVNPSQPGQAVTLTALVGSMGNNGIPTGSVTFYDGTTPLGTGLLDASGSSTLTTAPLSAGSHSFTALYDSDGVYSSSGGWHMQTVGQPSGSMSSTSLTSSASSSFPGQEITLTAAVGGSSGTPTGTATFYAGSNVLGSAALDANGKASLTTSAFSLGSQTITAIYSGDGVYRGNTATLTQTVNSVMSSMYLPPPNSIVRPGQAATFTARVGSGPLGGVPTGTVEFLDGATVLGSGSLVLVNGQMQAAMTTSALGVGDHTITALYNGDSTHSGTAATLRQAVSQVATNTFLTSSVNPSPLGQALTLTGRVSGMGGTPTGTVSYYDGTTLLGTGTLTEVNGQYQAAFTTSALGLGSHAIIAVYSGDSSFAESESSLEETITN